MTILPLTETQARAALARKPHMRGVATYPALRIRNGFLFTRPTDTPRGLREVVVADNGGSCHVSPDATPETLVDALIRFQQPSTFTEDDILCTCGHRSAQHGYGPRSANPVTGMMAGHGRGPCGARIPLDAALPACDGFETACNCARLDPEPLT